MENVHKSISYKENGVQEREGGGGCKTRTQNMREWKN